MGFGQFASVYRQSADDYIPGVASVLEPTNTELVLADSDADPSVNPYQIWRVGTSLYAKTTMKI